MRYPQAKFDGFLNHRTEFIQIRDTDKYKRARVQLHWKGIVLRDEVEGAVVKTKSQQIARQGELLVAEIDAKVGGVGIVPADLDRAIVSSHYFLFEIDESKCLRPWLDWFVRSGGLGDQFAARGSTNYAAIRPWHILNCEIPLPPLNEQLRLVSRIEELTARVENARRLRLQAAEEAEVLIASARRSLFGESPLGDWLPLSSFVAEIETGKSPQCEPRQARYDEWGVLKVGAISYGTFDENENKALPLGMDFDPGHEVRSGDFLMSRANTSELCGACAIVGGVRSRLLLSDKTFRFHFRPGTKIQHKWLDHVLKSPVLRSQIERGASGTSPTMKNISKQKVLALLLPPHAPSKQESIVEYLDALNGLGDSLSKLQSKTASEITALIPSILSKAFRGEL
jgi:type I restriction enzyme, S subunit